MSDTVSYAEPRVVDSVSDCFFYHVMDLPGVDRVGEQWDLRKTVDAYLGHTDVRGKRVLDVGAASGLLTFEMAKRGASVVSFDSVPDAPWDIAPIADVASGPEIEEGRAVGCPLTARALVAGAAGFIGSRSCRFLARQGLRP